MSFRIAASYFLNTCFFGFDVLATPQLLQRRFRHMLGSKAVFLVHVLVRCRRAKPIANTHERAVGTNVAIPAQPHRRFHTYARFNMGR